jgi:hypothetical protein
MPQEGQQPKNGIIALLTTLAQSGHAWVQFGTLLLIALTGTTNWVATWNSANQNKEQIEINRRNAWEGEQRIKAEVVRQVNEIHNWMREATAEFHQGNIDSAKNRKTLTELSDKLDQIERKLSVAQPPTQTPHP